MKQKEPKTRNMGKSKLASAPRRDWKHSFGEGQLALGWQSSAKTSAEIGFHSDQEKRVVRPSNQFVFTTNAESHILTIGPTGSGKGVSALIPNLLCYPGSAVVVDIKGEAAQVTAKRRREMGQEVVILDPFQFSGDSEQGSFNTFDVLHLKDAELSVEDLASECPALLSDYQASMSKEVFWDNKASDLIGGVVAAVLSTNPKKDQNWLAVRNLLMSDDAVYNLAVLMDTMGKKLPPIAHQLLANFLNTEEKCRSGIMATATQYFKPFYNRGVERAIEKTSFDLEAFREGKPMTIYLVIPPHRLHSHGRLLRIWISSLFYVVFCRKQKPELATLFMLDEAAQLGEMEQLRTAITLLRGYGVRTWSFFQDLSQIKKLYQYDWETLLNNSSVQVVGVNTQLAAEAISQITGRKFSPDEILNLTSEEELVIERGQTKKLRKLNYLTDRRFLGMAEENRMYRKNVAHSAGGSVSRS